MSGTGPLCVGCGARVTPGPAGWDEHQKCARRLGTTLPRLAHRSWARSLGRAVGYYGGLVLLAYVAASGLQACGACVRGCVPEAR